MRRYQKTALFLCLFLTLTGCGEKKTEIQDSVVQTVENQEIIDIPSVEELLGTSEPFTDRDKEIGYKEEESINIILSKDTATADSNSVSIVNNRVIITEEGTYIISGELTDGSIIVDAKESDKVQLVLNSVHINSSNYAAIYVKQADKVFITLAQDTENTLLTSGTFIQEDENKVDGVIFSKDDLTINGLGTLSIEAKDGHGIVSKDDLIITSGEYYITSAKHAISANDSIRIADGIFQISAGKDGIHCEDITYIAGGKINITESYEGIEGLKVVIVGGDIDLTSKDDGINAAGDTNDTFAINENACIFINGGKININASGDGIDSNGHFYMTGGETYVSGPNDAANGALDYNGSGIITGGTIIAAGSSGMAQNFSSARNQGSILVTFSSQQAGTEITLADDTDTMLLSWTSPKKYDCVVISCAGIKEGSNYTINAGLEVTTVEMENLLYGSSKGFGGGPGGFGGGPGGSQPPEGFTPQDDFKPSDDFTPPDGFDGRKR